MIELQSMILIEYLEMEMMGHLHDGTSQEQHEAPLLDEKHLTLDVKGFVDVLKKLDSNDILSYY